MAGIKTKKNLNIEQEDDWFCYLNIQQLTVDDMQQIITREIEYLEVDEKIGVVNDSIYKIKQYLSDLNLNGNEKILVIGANQGLVSILLKKFYPHTYVVTTDIASVTLHNLRKYEQILQNQVDEKWIINPCDMPFCTAQFDLVLSFDILNHYSEAGSYKQLLSEMIRVLKPNGKILLFAERYMPKYLSIFTPLFPLSKRFNFGSDHLNLEYLQFLTTEMLCQTQVSFEQESDRITTNSHNLFLLIGKYINKIIGSLASNRVNVIISKPIYAHEEYFLQDVDRLATVKSSIHNQ